MPDNFDIYFNRVIGFEDGYVNDPNDPGGETKWGISKRAYPNLIIKDLTRDDAKGIYKRDFWDVLPNDILSESVKYQLLDFAINSGITTTIRYLQRAIGVADDGFFGPVSNKALKSMSDIKIITNLNSERLDFMTRLKNWPSSGKGWARRIAQNLKYEVLDVGVK